MSRPGPLLALLALVAGVGAIGLTGLTGCGKTCDRTWKRIARCAGETAPDGDAEAAFRKQCKKLAKPALRRCLQHEGCDRFQACVERARARTPGGPTRCQRVLERALVCERERKGDRAWPLRPEKRQAFELACPRVPGAVLDACLAEEGCPAFRRCARRALRSDQAPETVVPVPPPQPIPLPGMAVDPTVELQILPAGELRLDRVPFTLDQLEPALRAVRRDRPGLRVQLRADERAAHAQVVQVIDVLTRLEIRFSLAR